MRWMRFLAAALVVLLPLVALADSGFPFVSLATTNCQMIVKGPVRLSGMTMGNTGAAAWIKFYNTSVTPTAGVGTPYPFPVPGSATLAGSNTFPPFPLLFPSGIGMCATGGAAANDTTTIGANQLSGTIFYQ